MKPKIIFSNEETLQQNPATSLFPFFLKTLKIEIVSEIKRCFQLWQEFSPQKTLFDTWEFRFAFYLAYKYKPHFILIKDEVENLALLPLWYEDDEKRYCWFGSWWQEENKFFVKNDLLIPFLLSLAPKPSLLNAISLSHVLKVKESIAFKKDDPKYILNLENIKSSEDYLMKLKKNTRRNLRKDRNKILRRKPKIIINNFSHFDDLIRLSKERFEKKGEKTDWEDPRRRKAFQEVINLAGRSYQVRMISVLIEDKIAGVDLIAIYNRCYYTLRCGYDIDHFSGIGNFLNLFEIDDAISLKMKKIDFLQNNHSWKNKLFTPLPLLKYEKS